MADNAGENKNNCIFQFCSELILRKWFDKIEMLFGPVGHTHNGNDAVHYIHNQIAGNFCSITPAELFNNYNHAWHSERTRPQPIIVETQYAWSQRFAPLAVPVSGFTKTEKSPDYIRAFKFEKTESGLVAMQIKGSPTSDTWYGVGSIPNGEGFICLKGAPPGYPLPKNPTKFKIKEEYVNRLNSDAVKKYCRDNGRGPMHEHLMIMARELIVPSVPLSGEQLMVAPVFVQSPGQDMDLLNVLALLDVLIMTFFVRAKPYSEHPSGSCQMMWVQTLP
jgi:hypothetical protein